MQFVQNLKPFEKKDDYTILLIILEQMVQLDQLPQRPTVHLPNK